MKRYRYPVLIDTEKEDLCRLISLIGSPERADIATEMILEHWNYYNEGNEIKMPYGIAGNLILNAAQDFVEHVIFANYMPDIMWEEDIHRGLRRPMTRLVRLAISPSATIFLREVVRHCIYDRETKTRFVQNASWIMSHEEEVLLEETIEIVNALMAATENLLNGLVDRTEVAK